MKINLSTIKYFALNRANQTQRQNGFVVNPFAQNQKDSVEISFKATKYCATQDFQIKDIPNLYCPACGLVMLNDKQIGSYIKDVGNKKGEELIATLEKYEDDSVVTGKPSRDKTGFGIYRPYKKEVVDLYKELARENPDEDLLGLTRVHAKRCIEKLIEEQMVVIEELQRYINANYKDEEKDALLEKVDEFVKQIKGESDETFARKKFTVGMRNAVNSTREKNEIDAITNKMPTSENDINSFFVKYARKAESSKEIATKFVEQSKPTAEHLRPKNAGGKNNLANYICDCADCNQKRGHTPFTEWLQTLPGFEQRLQQYIDDVRVAIDNDELDDEYDTYIENIVETIAEISEGEIILEVPEVLNPEKNEAAMRRRKNEIEKLKAQNEQLIKTKEALEAEIAELEKYPNFDDVDEHREINESIEVINREIEQLNQKSSQLEGAKYRLRQELNGLESIVKSASAADKPSLQARYDAKAKELEDTEKEIDRNKDRVGELKRKKIRLKKQKKGFVASEEAIKTRCEQFRALALKIKELRERIDRLNYIEKEAILLDRIAECKNEIFEREVQNNQIIYDGQINPSDTTDFNKYNRLNDLKRTAENILKGKDCKKFGANSGQVREIIEMGRQSIELQIKELARLDSVIYFLNLNEIKAQQSIKEKLEAKLAEIEEVKAQSLALQAEVAQLCGDMTEDEVAQEAKRLQQETRIISDIHALSAKRNMLNHLKKMIRKNGIQFKKLEDYKNLRNNEYEEILSFIDVSNVF